MTSSPEGDKGIADFQSWAVWPASLPIPLPLPHPHASTERSEDNLVILCSLPTLMPWQRPGGAW